MPEPRRFHHISSAVVSVWPGSAPAVMKAIAAMDRTEIPAHEGGRIVVVMEGGSAGELGDRLTAIACLDGVISANLVFEHIEELEVTKPCRQNSIAANS
jgi:nitrate reductase NapD